MIDDIEYLGEILNDLGEQYIDEIVSEAHMMDYDDFEDGLVDHRDTLIGMIENYDNLMWTKDKRDGSITVWKRWER